MSTPVLSLAGPEGGPLAAAVLAGSAVLTLEAGRVPWWGSAGLLVVLAAVVCLPVRGRTPARWVLAVLGYRLGRVARARARAIPAAVTDVRIAAGVCGIGETGDMLIAMVQLAPNLDLPTVIGEKSIYTEDTVPVELLAGMCEQYGLRIDIDVVTTGRRVRPVGAYGELYGQLIGPRPVVGQRLGWLVLRLDQRSNLTVLRRRGPLAVAGPKALAAAAYRVAGRLREAGIAAHPLPAAAMREATETLCDGVDLDRLRERWGRLDCTATGRRVTVYAVERPPAEDAELDDCWSWGAGYTTMVLSLSQAAPPRILMRYIGSDDLPEHLPSSLRLLTGRQSDALRATLPGAIVVRELVRAEPEDAIELAELRIAIGPNGQVLGAISGRRDHSLALPLYDPVHYHPRRRSIDVHAELPVAQQIVLRATVVGANVAIYTDRPDRWARLVQAVGDQSSLRLADAAADPAATAPTTIAVFDQVSPRTSDAPTTMTITAPGGPRRPAADLAIDQVGDTAVEVSIPMRTVRVNLIEPRGETRYVERLRPDPPAGSSVQAPDQQVNCGDAR